jgi:hypothetical protein
MTKGRLFGLILGVLTMLFLLAGCAPPPEAERLAAKGAMDAAVSAGADKYAVADLDVAKRVWEKAESQMNEKNYKEAKLGYMDAKVAFEKAGGAAASGKKAASEQASAALAPIEESWKGLEAKAQKMAKQMNKIQGAWGADSDAFHEGVVKAKEMIASDPAGVKPKLDELKAMVDKWDSVLKEMAAAPVKPPVTKKAKKPATKKVKKPAAKKTKKTKK